MRISFLIVVLGTLNVSTPLWLSAQVKPAVGKAASTPLTPTAALDRFIKACDMGNPAIQKLAEKGNMKLAYRGHTVSNISGADADNVSVLKVFFDDFLDAEDESGVADLWYPSKQALREASNASGQVDYSDRKFRISKREKATMRVIRLSYMNRDTGKLFDSKERSNYGEAPKDAKWLIECTVTW
jgi:hypothetical protein